MTAVQRARWGIAILLAAVIAFWAFVTAPVWYPVVVR